MLFNFFIRFVTAVIPSKKLRHQSRDWLRAHSHLLAFRPRDLILLNKFRKAEVHPNSILISEHTNGHSEVVIGMAAYFVKLGYNVDILLTHYNFTADTFCRYHEPKIRLFEFGIATVRWLLNLNKIKKYEHVLLNTTSTPWSIASLLYIVGKCPKGKGRTLFVEHDLRQNPVFQMEEHMRNRQVIVLGHLSQGVMVNPHYFGNVKITPKNMTTRFITVGAINPAMKNHQALIEATRTLAKQGLPFKVVIIGRGTMSDLPADVRPYIDFKGCLDFPQMYDEMEQADYFLPLLDPQNERHRRYIATGVTGSAQLIYGFAKPAVIQKEFADFYLLNNDNSITYEHDMIAAMAQAISQSPQDYEVIQSNLQATAAQLEAESLHNLKEILHG